MIFNLTDSEYIDRLVEDYYRYEKNKDYNGMEAVACELYEKYGIVHIGKPYRP